jgi:gamma-glutamylcyclotransferase (GGCT)/AIG2-like uncharacterized protein YtfP
MGRINSKYKNKILVAVYGTLKEDFVLGYVLKDSIFHGKGETFERYFMTT